MARKRGGIAGFYDRNKKIIKPLATGIAGALTGGVGAAALGGLMSGLDRQGKGGIGFDLKQGAKGAIQGYGTGATGAGIKGLLTGGLKSNMTAMEGMRGAMKNYNRLPFGLGSKAAAPGAQAAGAASKSPVGMLNAPTDFADVADIGSKYITPMPAGMPPLMSTDLVGATVRNSSPSRFGNLGSLFGKDGMIEQNKTLLSGIGKGVMGTRSAALEAQTAEDARLQREAELKQRQYEFDKTYGLDAAQEADRKRREDQLQAQRAAFRAMFTGMA